MKKINTTTTKAFKKMEELTIGLDLGDRSSWYCVLDERGELVLEQKVSTTAKAIWKRCSGHAREPHPTGDGDALAVGEPVVKRVGARSDCGARTRNTREVDHFPLRSRSSIFRSAPRSTSLVVR